MLNYKTIENKSSSQWVVFIHGAGGSYRVWFKQIRDFSKHYNLLLLDLRGHGESIKKKTKEKSKKYTIMEIANDVVELLKSLNLKQCHLVGLSLGSIVNREIAERNKELVKSMIMTGAVIKYNFRSKTLVWIANKSKYVVPYLWLYKIYAHIFMPLKKHKESRKLFVAESLKITKNEFMNWMTLNSGLNKVLSKHWESEPEIPTLYVMGENDYIFLPQVRLYLNNHCKYSSLSIVSDAGHICNIDQSEAYNNIAINFLDKIIQES
ncbi:MAG: alpha/beta hydrolase [Bacteroidales bacterium]|jgi:pimeloyl-ACP methyl ester carboxylesterase